MLPATCMCTRAGSIGSGCPCGFATVLGKRCQEKQGWQMKWGEALHVPFQAGFEDNFSSFHKSPIIQK